jgi:hypothetical protein
VVPATQAAAVDGSITPVDRAGNHADQSAPAAVIVVVFDGAPLGGDVMSSLQLPPNQAACHRAAAIRTL